MSETTALERWSLGADRGPEADEVATEEPLEIQIQGAQVAVVMRTPGHDLDLVRGFLVTEQVLSGPEEIAHIAHCDTVPDPEAEDNIVRVRLVEGARLDLARLKRNLYATSSCGVCGKATIENALALAGPLDDDPLGGGTRVEAETLLALPERLREAQEVFTSTGGLHAAGLFTAAGERLCVREDVGRHNAVDKVIGWALGEGRLPLSGHVLQVSGRVSFEVVQKAAAARVPVVTAVSAPTSLAVRTAEALGITLVGFVRRGRGNVYTHPGRIKRSAP